MQKLAGKVAVVTGGNSGIGLATAKLFRREGARVAISGRDQGTLQEAMKIIGSDVIAVGQMSRRPTKLRPFFAPLVKCGTGLISCSRMRALAAFFRFLKIRRIKRCAFSYHTCP